VSVIPDGTVPLVLGLYSDATTVVSFGTRSLHVASMCLLNSTLCTGETIRPLMFIPSVSALVLSPAKKKLLGQLIFNASWEACCQTLRVQIGTPTIDCVTQDRSSVVRLYPSIRLFLADTPEQNRVLSHRNGGLTEEICGRCQAKKSDFGLNDFALRLNRKVEIDRLLLQIVERDDIGGARVQLQEQSQLQSWTFTDCLRHFDAALCCPTCSLHTGQILWSKTLLELVGTLAAKCDEAERAPKRGRLKKDAQDLILVKRINAQFRRLGWLFDLFDGEGSLDVGMKTGDILFDIIMYLPFVLFNLLDEDLQVLLDAAILWRSVLGMWFERGKDIERFK
jgi:hypothetical protein